MRRVPIVLTFVLLAGPAVAQQPSRPTTRPPVVTAEQCQAQALRERNRTQYNCRLNRPDTPRTQQCVAAAETSYQERLQVCAQPRRR